MDLRRVAFGAVWLAIVGVAIGLIVVRRDGWGVWELAALVIAAGMVVVFVTTYVVRGPRPGARTRVGDYAVVAVIAGALAVLGVALVTGLGALSLIYIAVVGVFVLVFVGIFRDAVRALRKRRGDS